jgi:hypothetical protein
VKHTGKQLLRNVRCEGNITMQFTEVRYEDVKSRGVDFGTISARPSER